MPPKVKISKEMILDAGFKIIREEGYEHFNVRRIAEVLHCSTQPIMYNFKTVEEIRNDIYKIADEFHTNYIMPDISKGGNPLHLLGMNYIRFGYEEDNLFRFLFQSNEFAGNDVRQLIDNPDASPLINMVTMGIGCDVDEAKDIFLEFFCVVHGFASLLANNAMNYDEEQADKLLTQVFNGVIAVRDIKKT
ncbi:MAG: TetR/AcrR family transcriptional regulator [Lachnospiraceae bacterium]|nr:TetR/AcrR family transcriptional regulator [Lachnospiraceae bacterium]